MESTKHCFVPAIQQRIAQVVVGQEIVVERLLIALFTGGHILLEGSRAGQNAFGKHPCQQYRTTIQARPVHHRSASLRHPRI